MLKVSAVAISFLCSLSVFAVTTEPTFFWQGPLGIEQEGGGISGATPEAASAAAYESLADQAMKFETCKSGSNWVCIKKSIVGLVPIDERTVNGFPLGYFYNVIIHTASLTNGGAYVVDERYELRTGPMIGQKCEEGFQQKVSSPFPHATYYCEKNDTYVGVLHQDYPAPSCQVGNPIDSATGFKHQSETDIGAKNEDGVSLRRFYSTINSVSLWRHSYDAGVIILDPTNVSSVRAVSIPFANEETACSAGWANIKSKISDSWAINTSATFVDGKCKVMGAAGEIRRLGVVKNLAPSIYIVPGMVRLQRPAGSVIEYQFTKLDAGIFVATNGDRGTLQRIESGPVMWKYESASGETEEYSPEGKLISIIASNGVKQTLTHDAVTGALSEVKDSVGGKLTFTYTNGKLSSVTTNDNKITRYSYTGSLISDVIRPDNTTRTYHYGDTRFPTYLTGITDERGIRYATWKYDAQGRAISSEHAGGTEKTTLEFNADGSTTVTNPFSKKTIYRFADIAGARRVTSVEGQPTANCVGANQNYEYTSEGWVKSKTDWKGNKTSYVYNSFGQETLRTEADGTANARVIKTDWDPVNNRKVKVTEPETETTFIYDANGLIKSQAVRS